MSYRLLDGSSRFKELHEIVRDAKAKLETEVGPVNGMSAKMARGIVSRLPVAAEVQKLCSLAIDKADELLAAVSNKNATCRGNLFCVHCPPFPLVLIGKTFGPLYKFSGGSRKCLCVYSIFVLTS